MGTSGQATPMAHHLFVDAFMHDRRHSTKPYLTSLLYPRIISRLHVYFCTHLHHYHFPSQLTLSYHCHLHHHLAIDPDLLYYILHHHTPHHHIHHLTHLLPRDVGSATHLRRMRTLKRMSWRRRKTVRRRMC